MSERDSSSLLWFLAGIGIGAAGALLYAPQSGEETREALRSKAEESREYMREKARRAKIEADQWVERSKEAVAQQKEQIRSAFEAGRQAYKEATSTESSS
jgi:gas vesicle protein